MFRNDHGVVESMSTLIRGYDYRRGVDLALTGAQWRSLLSAAAYTRRIGTGVLAFERRDGATSLAYEVYDDGGAMPSPRRWRT
jgi:hypothetical protein